jgi:hypothetical protein
MTPTHTPAPVVPFGEYAGDLLETSARALTASAELYAELIASQARVTTAVVEAALGFGREAATTGTEVAERTEQAATRVARGTARSAQRATRTTARATRKAVKETKAAVAAPVEPPFAGYGELTAEEIVAKLPEQPQPTLAKVAAWERAHDARTTVLERVAALSGPEPAPGYDALTADEAQRLVTSGDAALAAAVRDYERRHKARASVLETATRHADAA